MLGTVNVKIRLITRIGTIAEVSRPSRRMITKTAANRPKTAVEAPAVNRFGSVKTYAATLPPSPASR